MKRTQHFNRNSFYSTFQVEVFMKF